MQMLPLVTARTVARCMLIVAALASQARIASAAVPDPAMSAGTPPASIATLPTLPNAPVAPVSRTDLEQMMLGALRGYDGSLAVIDLKTGEEYTCGPHLEEALMPASTFKLVSSYFLLSTGRYRPGDTLNCSPFYLGRRRYRCWNHSGHGDLDVIKALAVSCNGFFFSTFDQDVLLGTIELALRAGYTLVEGEAPHVAPDPLIHGDGIKIRPIDQARLIAALAPGQHHPGVKGPRDVFTDPVALAEIRKGMEAAVTEGSGRGCRIFNYAVAGKTGSWKGSRWFASYAPAAEPRWVVCAYTRGGGIHGGVDVCRRFYDSWLRSQGMTVASPSVGRRRRRRR